LTEIIQRGAESFESMPFWQISAALIDARTL
jgi:hypothetical protein